MKPETEMIARALAMEVLATCVLWELGGPVDVARLNAAADRLAADILTTTGTITVPA